MITVLTPASRATDPETSHIAEEIMNRCGKRAHQQRIIIQYLAVHPDSTAAELANAIPNDKLDHAAVQRRLSDLCGIAVEKTGRRACRVKGTLMTTWNVKESAND